MSLSTDKAGYYQCGDRDILTQSHADNITTQLVCYVQQYLDPSKPESQWKKSVILTKEITDSSLISESDYTNWQMVNKLRFSSTALQTVLRALCKSISKVRQAISSFKNTMGHGSATNFGRYIGLTHGLVVECAIPVTPEDEEANKQLVETMFSRTAGRQHSSITMPEHWREIISFSNPISKQSEKDEIMTTLVKTAQFGQKMTDPASWLGVSTYIHRIVLPGGHLAHDSNSIILTPKETLSLLHYLCPPEATRQIGPHSCIATELGLLQRTLYKIADQNLYTTGSYDDAHGQQRTPILRQIVQLAKDDNATVVHDRRQPPPLSLHQLLFPTERKKRLTAPTTLDAPDGGSTETESDNLQTTPPSSQSLKKALSVENSRPPQKRGRKRVSLRDLDQNQELSRIGNDTEKKDEDDEDEDDDAALLEIDI